MITIKNRYTGEVILEIESLQGANLSYANLRNADLSYANLSGATLSDADLSYANLRWCVGNLSEIKSAQFNTYMISWSKDTLAIGCQQHSIEAWWSFDDDTIAKMDKGALIWWKKWKPVLQQLIEVSA